jgi:pimeloyl-ACP methyl ester carboxylesterase
MIRRRTLFHLGLAATAPSILTACAAGFGPPVSHHSGLQPTGNVIDLWPGRGIAALVLLYRLPADGWSAGPNAPLQDAQRAARLIRRQAPALGLDPNRVAVMGFSAGGHLAARLATRYSLSTYDPIDETDELPARPDLAALATLPGTETLPGTTLVRANPACGVWNRAAVSDTRLIDGNLT